MVHHPITGNYQEIYEVLIRGMLEEGVGFSDAFLDEDVVRGLRRNLLRFKREGKMHPAGIGRQFDYQKNTRVRGDVIRWIEKDTRNKHERSLLEKIEEFVQYLNRTCYAGIRDYEFHYAYYEVNTFYKRHLDQFKNDKGRKYSLVMYLNKNWKEKDGGKLTLFLPDDSTCELYPLAGRAVFFKADQTEHEVSPSINRYRLSIAGWLKND